MKKFWTYVIGVLLIAGGILLLINPEQSFSKLVLCVGFVLVLTGGYKIFFSVLKRNDLFLPGNTFLSGFFNVLFGLILILNSNLTVKIITIFIGLWLILSSVFTLVMILNFKNDMNVSRNTLFTSILKLVLGITVLVTPIVSVLFTGIFLGILLIVIGIYCFISFKSEDKIYKIKVK